MEISSWSNIDYTGSNRHDGNIYPEAGTLENENQTSWYREKLQEIPNFQGL